MSGGFSQKYLALFERPGNVSESPTARYLPVPRKGISERLIQLVWRNILYNNSSMQTTSGVPVRVLKPGRLNRREGPDFKNAVLLIGGIKTAGDVEIHVESKEWYEHKHHLSRRYGKCVLHVFLNRSATSSAAKTLSGRTLHELELGLYLRHTVDELQREIEFGDTPVSGRVQKPHCRRFFDELGTERTVRLLDIVGEGRLLIKSQKLLDRMETTAEEELLYSIFFESLGYSSFKKEFAMLAEAMPRKRLREMIADNARLGPHVVAQSLFFHLAGLLEDARGPIDSETMEILKKYSAIDHNGIKRLFAGKRLTTARYRPANSPYRRIAAFTHLIDELTEVEPYRQKFSAIKGGQEGLPAARKVIAGIMDRFLSVSDPFWDYRYSFSRKSRSPKKLIGKDRAVSLVVDCLIPFFLALSRSAHDIEMEKKLVSAVYATPKPSSNSVVDFMARNLFGKEKTNLVSTALHQQALIQLHNDFCYRYPAFCSECPMPDFLRRFGKKGS